MHLMDNVFSSVPISFSCVEQRSTKVVSDRLGLVDFHVG